jgi:hypothetical protein
MAVTYKFNFGPTVDIQFGDGDSYLCEFLEHSDAGEHKLMHSAIVKDMCTYTPFREWYTKWVINIYKIKENELKLVDCHYFNLQSKNVYFEIDFSEYNSILNSLIIINDFVKKHKCIGFINLNQNHNVLNSTIKKEFPDLINKINFPDNIDFYASYHIGKYNIEDFSTKKFGIFEFSYPQVADVAYYYDSFRNKTNWKDLNDAQVTCDILNIDYKEEYNVYIEKEILPIAQQVLNKLPENQELVGGHYKDQKEKEKEISIPLQLYYDSNVNTKEFKKMLNEEIKNDELTMKERLINLYETTKITKQKEFIDKIETTFNFGPKVEILGASNYEYKVEFIDDDSGLVIYNTTIKPQHWCKANRMWYTNWVSNVYKDGELITSHKMDLTNTNVYILLDSKSLGDTIAWMPYAEEFRKKHNCILYCATFWNGLFEKEYKDIKFVIPDVNVGVDFYASYKIGYVYDVNKDLNKTDPRILNLQEVACDCLELDFFELGEIKAKIFIKKSSKRFREPYICIAPHSTAQSKYWNNKTGWQEIVDHVKKEFKFNTLCISKEGNGFMGNNLPKGIIDLTGDIDIQERITDIVNCEFFVGISTGLTWLAWALGKKVVLISGCTSEYNEMSDSIRIFPKENVCTGCFNDVRFEFDKGLWDWCPVNRGTDQQFECSKVITGQQVIEKIDSYVKNKV